MTTFSIKKNNLVLLLILLTIVIIPIVYSVLLNIDSSSIFADSYVDSTQPTENFGASTDLNVKLNTQNIYMRWNISSIPDDVVVTDASLNLNVGGVTSGTAGNYLIIQSYEVYNTTWAEGSGGISGLVQGTNLSWNNQPCGTGFTDSVQCNLTAESRSNFSNLPIGIQNKYQIVANLSSMVQKNLANDIFSFALRVVTQGGSLSGLSFDSNLGAKKPALNITYITTPTVTLSSPSSSSFTNNPSSTFICNSSYLNNVGLKNVTFYLWNSSGAIISNVSASITGTTNSSSFNYNFALDGVYSWNCLVFNNRTISAPESSTAPSNFTITIDSAIPVNVTFVSPTLATGSFTNNSNVTINATADDANLQSIVLRLYNATKVINQTNTSATSPLLVTFYRLVDGTYFYNATANDSAGNIAPASANTQNFTVDTTQPSINYVAPTNSSGLFVSQTYIEVNVTATDTYLQSILVRFYNSSGFQINSSTTATSPNYKKFLNLPDGIYYWNATANDSAGNSINLATRNMTLDSLTPTINFTSPTPANNTNTSTASVTFNITGIEKNIGRAILVLNSSTNYTLSCIGTSPYYCNTTQTSGDGTYRYYAIINDSAGHTNQTEFRNLTVDTTAPVTLAFPTSPPGGTAYTFGTWTSNNVKVTLIATDSGVGLDTSKFPVYCNDSLNSCYPTTLIGGGPTISSEGTSYIRYFSNDTLNNKEVTKSGTIMIDKTSPSVSILYPLSGYNVSVNNSLQFNFSATDAGTGTSICKWSINGGISNTTITCNINTTINIPENASTTLILYANDSLGFTNSTNVTFRVDATSPNAILNAPGNNTYNKTQSQNYSVNVTDNIGYKNATINIYNSTNVLVNTTTITAATSTVVQQTVGIVVALTDGIYKWAYKIFDWSGNSVTTQNNTIRIDSTPPYFVNIPTNSSLKYGQSLSVTFNATDNLALENFAINWTNTFSINSSGTLINTTGMSVGFYIINVTINDTLNNLNSTMYSINVSKNDVYTLTLTSAPSSIVNYGTQTTVTGASCPSQLTCSLTRNGGAVLNSDVQNLSAGVYIYNFSTSGNANYSATSITLTLNIIDNNITSNPLTINDWPIFAHDINRTGSTSATSPVNISTSGITTFTATNPKSSASISNGYLYLTSFDGKLYQLNASNISQLFNSYVTGSFITHSSPTVAGGYVYFGADNNKLYQVNATNVSLLVNTYTADRAIQSSPLAVNGYVYFFRFHGAPPDNETIYQVNAFNISQLVASQQLSGNNIAGAGFYKSPTSDGTSIYITGGTVVYQLNGSNVSQQIRNYTLDTAMDSSIAIANGYLYLGDFSGTIYQLNQSNISQLINKNATGGSISSSPAVSSSYVYINKGNGDIYQLNASNISVRINTYSITDATFGYNQGPIIAGDNLFALTLYGVVYQLNASNISKIITNYSIDGSNGYLSVSNGALYVPGTSLLYQFGNPDTISPTVYLLSPTNGTYVKNLSNYFYANFTDDVQLKSAMAIIYNATALISTNTTGNGGTSSTANLSLTVPRDGTYFWNYYVNDTSDNLGMNKTNFTLIVDTTLPVVSFIFPTNATGTNVSNSFILANVSVTEVNFANVTFNLFNATGLVNRTSYAAQTFFINWSSLPDANYQYNVTVTDLANNINTTETRLIRVDTTNPSAVLTSPSNNTYSNSVSTNFIANVTDNLGYKNATLNIWNNTALINQTTVTASTGSITSQLVGIVVTLTDGVFKWFYQVFDWSGNSAISGNNTLIIDSTNATAFYANPSDNDTAYLNRNYILINVTATDSNLANVTIFLYNSTNVVINTTITTTSPNFVNISGLADGIYRFNATIIDLANNKISLTTRTVIIDTTKPVPSFIAPTNSSGLNLTFNYILANVSVTETNFANITLNLYNNTALINSTFFTSTPYFINWSSLSNGNYFFNATATDLANNQNSTDTRTMRLDSINPNGTLFLPSNNSFVNNITQNYSVNVTDNLGFKNVTLNIYNSTNVLVNQTTTTAGSGSVLQQLVGTIVTLTDGVFKWFYNIIDWSGNSFTTNNNTITVDTTFPRINITYPTNNTNFSTNIVTINYTLVETNINNCWYTNSSGRTNNSITCGNNLTNYPWLEGLNNITIYANDSAGNINSSSVTFRVDTTAPTINVTSPTNSIYRDIYQLSVTLNVTATDSGAGINSYFYSLNNASNVTFTPNITLTGLAAGYNTLIVYVNDTVGNRNSSTIQFNMTFTPKINDINISNSSVSYDRNQNTSSSDGLVGWWRFDQNNSNQIDSSTSSNNGTVVNNASFVPNGAIGGAYYFNRDQASRVTIPQTNSLNFTKTNLSISYWIYPVAYNVSGGDPGVIASTSAADRNFNSIFNVNGAGKYVTFRTDNQSGGANILTSNKLVEYNAWHQVTLVFNGTGKQIWIDGALDNQVNWPYTLRDTSGGISIGTAVNNGQFNGTIDEVRIYNRSLSTTEIQNLYSVTKPTVNEYQNVTVNATVTDEDTPQANLIYTWYVDTVKIASNLANTIFNYIFTKQNQILTLVVNDTNNYNVTQNWNITTVFITPTINFTAPTQSSGANVSQNYIIINLSITEVNFANVTFNVYNSSNALVNSTIVTSTTSYLVNLSTFPNGNYSYNATVTDLVGNQNSTETRKITLDTSAPLVTISQPTATNYRDLYQLNYSLNVTATDSLSAISNYKWSLNAGSTNTTFTPNTTIIGLVAGSNTVTVFVTDLAGNINTSSVTFNLTFTPKIGTFNISNSSTSYSRNDITNSTSGLVGWFKLDQNNSNQIDNTTYSNNGTVIGTGASFNPNGAIGGAYNFIPNQNSYITIPDADQYSASINNQLTVVMWYKPNSLLTYNISGASIAYNQPLAKSTTSNHEWLFRFYNNTGQMAFDTFNLTGVAETDAGPVATLNTTINQWDMWVGTINTSTLCLYKNNGSVFQCVAEGSALQNGNSPLTIGTRQVDIGSIISNASIDEVRIYNRTLTVAEIQNLYSITYPIFNENANVTININGTIDEDTPQASLYYTWYVNLVKITSGLANTVFNYIFSQRNQLVTVVVNDSNNYNVTQNFNITTSFSNPQVNYSTPPTAADGANLSQDYIIVNVSIDEPNFANVTYTLHNATAQINITAYSTQILQINWSSLPNARYTYNVTVYDVVNNKNTTATRTVTLDTVAPTILINTPLNTTYRDLYDYNLSINISATDSLTGVRNGTWSLNAGSTNTSFIGNISGITGLAVGSNTATIFVTDYAGNTNSSSRTFNLTFTPKIINSSVGNSTITYNDSVLSGILSQWRLTDDSNVMREQTGQGNNGYVAISGKLYLPFDGNALDSSYNFITPNNRHGTVSGATLVNDRFGHANSSYSFDGAGNYIQTAKVFNAGINFTYSAWIYLNNVVGSKPIIDNNIQFKVNSNKLRVQWHDGTTWQTSDSSSILNPNTWYHVALTINNSNNTLSNSTQAFMYINGVQDSRTTSIINYSGYNPTFTTIGRDASNGAEFFNGSIDEVYITNTVLTANTIRQLYNVTVIHDLNKPFVNNDGYEFWGQGFGEGGSAHVMINTGTYISNNIKNISNFTMSAWVYRYNTTVGYVGDFSRFMGWYGGNWKGAMMSISNGGSVSYNIGQGFNTTGTGNNTNYNSPGVTTTVNSWHLLALTFNGSASILYIDGAQAQINTTIGPTQIDNGNGGQQFRIGGNPWDDNSAFNGRVKDVRVYNRSLSSSEMLLLYNAYKPVFQENANVTINVTTTDEDTSQANLYYTWYVDAVKIQSGLMNTIFNYIFPKKSQIVTVVINDTYNYTTTANWNISETFVNPTISFVIPPTPVNNTNSSSSSFTVNVTGTEVNRDTVYVNLNGLNYTMTCNGVSNYNCTYNFSALTDGDYTYQVFINDSVGNNASTPTALYHLDLTPPTGSILAPPNNTKVNGNLTIFGTFSDAYGVAYVSYQYVNATVLTYTNISTCNAVTSSTSFFNCVWNTAFFSDSAGGYDIRPVACDANGNCNTTMVPIHLVIDRTIPIVSSQTVTYPNSQTSAKAGQRITLRLNTTDGSGAGMNTSVVDLQLLNSSRNTTMVLESGGLGTNVFSMWNLSTNITALTTGIAQIPYTAIDNATPINNKFLSTFLVQLDNTPPNFTGLTVNPSPGPYYNNTIVNFSVSAADNYKLDHYIFSNNFSGTWINISTNFTNPTVDLAFNSSTMKTGSYGWYFIIFDDAQNTNQTAIQSITIGNNAPENLIVSLVSPADNLELESLTTSYTYNYTNGSSASACMLFIDNSQTNKTNNPAGNTNLIFSLTQGLGTYSWRVDCNNSYGTVFSSPTFTYTIHDITIPLINFTAPTATSGINLSHNYIEANVSATELNFQSITFNLFNDTDIVNSTTYSTALNATTKYINWSSLADGNYTYNVSILDTSGNFNTTENRYILLDTLTPQISFAPPTPDSGSNSTSIEIFVNVSVTETNENNITFALFNRTALVNRTSYTTAIRTINWSGLSTDKYFYNVTITDLANNINITSTNVIGLDTLAPNGTLLLTNGTFRNNLSVNFTVNATDDSTGLNNATVYVYNSSGTLMNQTTTILSGELTKILGTVITMVEGVYNYFYTLFDFVGNSFTTTNSTVTVDVTPPVVTITQPYGINYNFNTSLPLNVSSTDLYLQGCYYNLDNGANSTYACNQNVTFNTTSGSHSMNAFANDSAGNVGSAQRNFTINLAAPSITLLFPADNQWLNYTTNVNFNYSATATGGVSACQLWTNTSGTLAVNQTHQSPANGALKTFFLNMTDGKYIWNVFCNDTGNNGIFASQMFNYTIKLDTVIPTINYSSGTPVDGLNTTTNSLFINVSYTEINFANITYELYNLTSLVNRTIYSTPNTNITFNTLPDGNYSYNVTILDFASNSNSTATQTIKIDTTGPSVNITQPIVNANYNNNNSIELNYTVSDNLIGIQECHYHILNSSGSSMLPGGDVTITNCINVNTTFALPGGDVNYILSFFATDNLGNVNPATTVNFGIRTISPAITLLYPTNNAFLNYTNNVQFNFTASDNDGINNCSLYGNWTGTYQLNQTLTSVSSGVVTNFTDLNLSESNYLWGVICNDIYNNTGSSSNNTFNLDTTLPIANITSTVTAAGSQTFSFVNTANDTNLDICKYSIFDSTGAIDGISNNVNISCNALSTATTTNFGTYNLTFYAFDKAGNFNFSTVSLTITASSSSGGGGGGGGSGANITYIIAGNVSWSMSTDTGTNKYTLSIARGSTRIKPIIFKNLGVTEINLTLRCDGNLCKYLVLQSNNITLPVGLEIPTEDNFVISMPINITEGAYFANILGSDQQNNTLILSVEAQVGPLGSLIQVITKVVQAKQIMGVWVPYSLLALLLAIITYLICRYLIFRKLKNTRVGFALLAAITVFILAIIFL